MKRELKERDIERALVKFVKAQGGEVRKVKWIGRHSAPDRFVMLRSGSYWVELKAPNEKPTPAQLREHQRMRDMGQQVLVIDYLIK
jgi:hypothetical protein